VQLFVDLLFFNQEVFDEAQTSALSLAHANFNLETDKFLAKIV
jgi:hypothetical protein